jgi:hypothetical protein
MPEGTFPLARLKSRVTMTVTDAELVRRSLALRPQPA